VARRTFIQRSREKGAAEKAAYHQTSGAGKSRVKRPFVGLTRDDEDAIVDRIERHLDRVLRTR
jgi:phage gpG-like protein